MPSSSPVVGQPDQADQPPNGGPALSYLGLRKGVGLLGLALPIVLVLGNIWLDGNGLHGKHGIQGIQGSISGYYYTVMRDYFVGSNCATAVFLLCYRYRRQDNHLGNALAVFAVGLALFPTTQGANLTTGQTTAGLVHLLCSTLYFLCQAYVLFFLFTRTDPGLIPTRQKRQRNLLYRVSGITIVACLVLVAVANNVLTKDLRDDLHPVFWLESIAVWALSVSWLIKGEFLFLKDRVDHG